MMFFSVSLDFESIDGTVSFMEREDKTERGGGYTSHDLVSRSFDDISFRIYINEEQGLAVELSAHHVENEEAKRAFHSYLIAPISRDHLKQLHNYIEFLLSLPEDLLIAAPEREGR